MGLCGLFNRKTNNDRRSTKDQQQVVQPGAVQEGRPQQTPSAQTTAPSSTKEQSELKPLGDGQTPLPFLENLPKFYTYEQLAKATGDFTNNNLIGVGGSGQVFRGELPDGKVVAIKKLKYTAGQAELEGAQAQFETEIKTNSSIRHRNLVEVIGYCSDKADQLFVCEFVPNKSLRYHLHGKEDKIINWPNRMKIAVGSAKGLAYLHEGCPKTIIHRDIKSENILLDHNFEPKIADFGLAKVFLDYQTHVSTKLRGTFGYLAPEYIKDKKITVKSDVFSFGVVLLELITGKLVEKEGNDSRNLALRATSLLKQALDTGNYKPLVDSKLQDYNKDEMTRMIYCAIACVYKPESSRPKMSQIFEVLQDNMAVERIWVSEDVKFIYDGAPYYSDSNSTVLPDTMPASA
ncbi:hypothetical protein P3X46_001403 [Hevea brasiliensis]|uniref:non-specific serine/threonine protein kinase n=1 Tax=Hevea brasiliensis TaxID=3981 RepID=A0ABQ9NEA1_HEVBR|nr:hypothetical protein P3X46_001403 [Hevea brasiliensis]